MSNIFIEKNALLHIFSLNLISYTNVVLLFSQMSDLYTPLLDAPEQVEHFVSISREKKQFPLSLSCVSVKTKPFLSILRRAICIHTLSPFLFSFPMQIKKLSLSLILSHTHTHNHTERQTGSLGGIPKRTFLTFLQWLETHSSKMAAGHNFQVRRERL